MKRAITLLVSFSSVCLLHIAAQPPNQPPAAGPAQQLRRALDLIQQGRPATAVLVLTSLSRSAQFGVADRGRACALLGYAYKEEGQFTAAERSFTEAFALLTPGANPDDYAAALSYYAGLLIALNDLHPAEEALQQEVELYRQIGNHAGLSGAYTQIASLEISRKKYRQARALLASARAEANAFAHPDPLPDPDLDATIGQLDSLTGHYREAVSDYEAALVACRRKYGDQHMFTGWSLLLLGKAQQDNNDLIAASRSMTTGLQILKETVGTNSVRYLAGQLAWSGLLDRMGSHEEAERISVAATASLRKIEGPGCANCTVSIWSLQHQSNR